MSGESGQKIVDVIMVLDRSGSMEAVRADTIGGVNAFIEDQQSQGYRARMTMVLFDHEYEVVHLCRPIEQVERLSWRTFVPRGTTALLDAWGRAMAETEARLAALPESEQPSKVVFVVVTDGHENASQEFEMRQVSITVRRHRHEDGWEFVFLGADKAAIAEGARCGVDLSRSLVFQVSSRGTASAFRSISAGVARTAAGLVSDDWFTSEERDEQRRLSEEASRRRKKKRWTH